MVPCIILLELLIIELAAIVCNKGMWDSKPCYDVLMDIYLDFSLDYGQKSFRFSLLGTIVDGNYNVMALPLEGRGEERWLGRERERRRTKNV